VLADQSNRYSLGDEGTWGSSSCSGSSQAWTGSPTSSENQWFRSTILHRNEQKGIDGAWMSAAKYFRQVGHWISGKEAMVFALDRKLPCRVQVGTKD